MLQNSSQSAPELSIITPTFNERDNIAALLKALEAALAGMSWELIVVDDNSADDTATLAKDLAQENPRLRCIRRVGRRGLSSAAIEGFLASSAPYIALIDADLQHDETQLPLMLEKLRDGKIDLVVGSRYAEGGSAAGLSDGKRALLSRWGGILAKRLLGAEISDPMSGFFAMRRDVFDQLAAKLSGQGFKILVDILSSASPPLQVMEIAYTFKPRHAGISKLDTAAKLDYLLLLLDKLLGQMVPLRFILFSAVGALGIGVHLAMLAILHFWLGAHFALAQGLAALTAMTTNFLLNNAITYRDRRLKGWNFMRGLVSFYVVCSIGFLANVGVADALFGADHEWWLAGIAGALVGTVWNYAASSALTWKMRA